MSDLTQKFSSHDMIVVLVFAGILITALVWTALAFMQMLHNSRREMAIVELKRELACQGMTAEQIVAVLAAGTGDAKQSLAG